VEEASEEGAEFGASQDAVWTSFVGSPNKDVTPKTLLDGPQNFITK
jgi:hypothetical protein